MYHIKVIKELNVKNRKVFESYVLLEPISQWFSLLIAVGTFVVIIEKFVTLWNDAFGSLSLLEKKVALSKAAACSILLLVAPFVNIKKYENIFLILTAIISIGSIITLESVFGRRQCFVLLYVFTMFGRCLKYRNFNDSCALVCAFSLDIGSLSYGNYQWYIAINVCVFSYFFMVWIFESMHRRFSLRIWQYMRFLFICKEKCKQNEKHCFDTINNHLHPNIIKYLSTRKVRNFSSKKATSPSAAAAAPEPKPPLRRMGSFTKLEISSSSIKSSEMEEDEELFRFTVDEGIIHEFNEDSLPIQQLRNLEGLEKKDTVLIGFKIYKDETFDCAYMRDKEECLHEVILLIATKYKVTEVRRFGDIWVGCIGQFDQTWGSNSVNCYQGFLFCVHVSDLVTQMNWKIQIAADVGNIVMGFLPSSISPLVDIYGLEIRWLLQVLHSLKTASSVLLSTNMKLQLAYYYKSVQKSGGLFPLDPSDPTGYLSSIVIQYVKTHVLCPWKKEGVMEVFMVGNLCDFIITYELSEVEWKQFLASKPISSSFPMPKLNMNMTIDQMNNNNNNSSEKKYGNQHLCQYLQHGAWMKATNCLIPLYCTIPQVEVESKEEPQSIMSNMSDSISLTETSSEERIESYPTLNSKDMLMYNVMNSINLQEQQQQHSKQTNSLTDEKTINSNNNNNNNSKSNKFVWAQYEKSWKGFAEESALRYMTQSTIDDLGQEFQMSIASILQCSLDDISVMRLYSEPQLVYHQKVIHSAFIRLITKFCFPTWIAIFFSHCWYSKIGFYGEFIYFRAHLGSIISYFLKGSNNNNNNKDILFLYPGFLAGASSIDSNSFSLNKKSTSLRPSYSSNSSSSSVSSTNSLFDNRLFFRNRPSRQSISAKNNRYLAPSSQQEQQQRQQRQHQRPQSALQRTTKFTSPGTTTAIGGPKHHHHHYDHNILDVNNLIRYGNKFDKFAFTIWNVWNDEDWWEMWITKLIGNVYITKLFYSLAPYIFAHQHHQKQHSPKHIKRSSLLLLREKPKYSKPSSSSSSSSARNSGRHVHQNNSKIYPISSSSSHNFNSPQVSISSSSQLLSLEHSLLSKPISHTNSNSNTNANAGFLNKLSNPQLLNNSTSSDHHNNNHTTATITTTNYNATNSNTNEEKFFRINETANNDNNNDNDTNKIQDNIPSYSQQQPLSTQSLLSSSLSPPPQYEVPVINTKSTKEKLTKVQLKQQKSLLLIPSSTIAATALKPSQPQQQPLPNETTNAPTATTIQQAFNLSRDWKDYLYDAHIYYLHSTPNLCMVAYFYVISIYASSHLISNEYLANSWPYIAVFFIYFFWIQSFRRHNSFGFFGVVLILYVALYTAMPCEFQKRYSHSITLVTNPFRAPHSESFGDFGGEVYFLMLFLFRVPIQIYQPPVFSTLVMVLTICVFFLTHGNVCAMPKSVGVNQVTLWMLFVGWYTMYQYHVFQSYFLEHIIMPCAIRIHEQHLLRRNELDILFTTKPGHHHTPHTTHTTANTTNTTNTTNTSTKHNKLNSKTQLLYNQNISYSWFVIHFKGLDLISTVLNIDDFVSLLIALDSIVMDSLKTYGATKLMNLSGVYIGFVSTLIRSKYDVIVMLHHLRRKIDDFNRSYQMHISVGMSVSKGDDIIRYSDHSFSIDSWMKKIGNRCDMLISMACYNEEGIYATKDYEKALRKMIPSHELIRKQWINESIKMKRKHFWEEVKHLSTNVALNSLQTVSSSPEEHAVQSLLRPLEGEYWLRVNGPSQGIHIDDFTYIRMLGKGGYGSVHLVCDKHSGEKYAIKVILPRKGMSQMIKQECTILQTMQHPNVVGMKYSFMANHRLYLAMDYIDGANLKQIVDNAISNSITAMQYQRWFAQLIIALEYVHKKGIIHCDVKPANCMIGLDGLLKLADFGLAKSIRNVKTQLKAAAATSRLRKNNNNNNADNNLLNLQLSKDALQKLQKFLPAKQTSQNNNNNNLPGSPKHKRINNSSHRNKNLPTASSDLLEVTAMIIQFTNQSSNASGSTSSAAPFTASSTNSTISFSSTASIPTSIEIQFSSLSILHIENVIENGVTVWKLFFHKFVFKCIVFSMGNSTRIAEYVQKYNVDALFLEYLPNASKDVLPNDLKSIFATDNIIAKMLMSMEEIIKQVQFVIPVFFFGIDNKMMINYLMDIMGVKECFGNAIAELSEDIICKIYSMEAFLDDDYDDEYEENYDQEDEEDATYEASEATDTLQALPYSKLNPARNNTQINAASVSMSTSISLASTTTATTNNNTFNQAKTISSIPLMIPPIQTKREEPTDFMNSANGNNGNAAAITGSVSMKTEERKNIVGTLYFLAPEIITEHCYDRGIDWWATAITFYYCLTKKPLFQGFSAEEILTNIVHQTIDLSHLSSMKHNKFPHFPFLEEFLLALLNRNRLERLGNCKKLTFEENMYAMKTHPFFQRFDWSRDLYEYHSNKHTPNATNNKKNNNFTITTILSNPKILKPMNFSIKHKVLFYGEDYNAMARAPWNENIMQRMKYRQQINGGEREGGGGGGEREGRTTTTKNTAIPAASLSRKQQRSRANANGGTANNGNNNSISRASRSRHRGSGGGGERNREHHSLSSSLKHQEQNSNHEVIRVNANRSRHSIDGLLLVVGTNGVNGVNDNGIVGIAMIESDSSKKKKSSSKVSSKKPSSKLHKSKLSQMHSSICDPVEEGENEDEEDDDEEEEVEVEEENNENENENVNNIDEDGKGGEGTRKEEGEEKNVLLMSSIEDE